VIRRQALKALRLMALVLLPLAPVAIALAPGLIPTLIGDKWSGMVAPFQILIVVGVGQGLLNVLGEVFAGAGGESLRRRARIDMTWAITTLALIAVGVQLWGIKGAAAVHVVSLCMLAAAYAWWGGRAVGLTPGGITGALSDVSACVLAQAVATAIAALAIRAAGGGALAAGLAGAVAGLLTFALMLRTHGRDLLAEGRGVVYAAINRQPA